MVIATLRPFRTPQDYVGGGAALNRDWLRLSDDIDIFHDNRARVPQSVDPEIEALRDKGFNVNITVSDQSVVEIIAEKYGFETKVQWSDDHETCRRFFPAVEDKDFGFRLHEADNAVNKVLCASSRNQAVRDAVDLVNIVRLYAPLGPLIWATAGKDEQLNPLRVAQDIRNIAFGYSDEEIRTVRMEGEGSITRDELRETLEPALDDARSYCEDKAPDEYIGHLFVNDKDIPIKATREMIASGITRVLSVKDFGAIPQVSD